MSRVLVKIARDLNVGTATIVEHLNSKGFDIENKPNAKITDGMYDELTRHFQKSIEIKDPTNNSNIGSSRPTLSKPVVLGKIDLSERLKQRIEKTNELTQKQIQPLLLQCYEEKTKFLDLGNCGWRCCMNKLNLAICNSAKLFSK